MTTPQADTPPARKNRKVLWIVLGVIGFLIFCMLAFAAMGLYFVSRNLDMQTATASEAGESFESVRAKFKDTPIISLSADEEVTLNREPPAQSSGDRPTTMHVMAYDRSDERIVRVTIPFWMLRLGREKIRLGSGDGLDFEQLHITAEELERYGPSLLLDHVEGTNRVLVWTQ